MSESVPYEQALQKNPRRWLVTGAAGFIGSHIAERLLSLGQKVVVLDDFSTGHERNLPARHENLLIIRGDIRDASLCRKACAEVDIVLHHAAIGSVAKSISDPVFVDSVNVGGTITVLMAAIEAGVKRFVFASSSAVYGDSGREICAEDQELLPKSPYAVTKRACEYYASILGKHHGLCTTGLRYFNVYGPRQDPNGAYAAVIPRWIDSMLTSDRAIEIYGDGKTVRDFCFIQDVVNANIQAALADADIVNGQAYNIASGSATTLNDLYKILSDATGREYVSPVYQEFRAGDIKVSCASIAKAEQDFGYMPVSPLSDGLKRTLDWYKGR